MASSRRIFEATEKEYDTSHYRNKLCSQWVLNQREQQPTFSQPKSQPKAFESPDFTNAFKTSRQQPPNEMYQQSYKVASKTPFETLEQRFRQSEQRDRSQKPVKQDDPFVFEDFNDDSIVLESEFGFGQPNDEFAALSKKDKKAEQFVDEFADFDVNADAKRFTHVEPRKRKASDTCGDSGAKRMIYKRVKEKRYAEMLDTTPIWTQDNVGMKFDDEQLDPDPFAPDKKPLEKYRPARERNKYALQTKFSAKNEVVDFGKIPSKVSKGLNSLIPFATGSATQPIICNIKCNIKNLIIKTD